MKLLTVTMPDAEAVPTFDEDGNMTDPGTISPQFLGLLIQLSAQWKVAGRRNVNGLKMANAVVNDLFVAPGEVVLDDNGDPLPETPMPPGWTLISAHKINDYGRDKVVHTPQPPVTIDAATITDTVINRSQRYARHYVKPVVDATDPDNSVVTGVVLYTRTGQPIPQSWDNTDPQNPVPIYEIPGATPDRDGSYTKTWTEPGKDVPGVGVVTPDQLEPNGDYIHTPVVTTVVTPGLEEIIPMNKASYIQYMPDIPTVDAQGNVTSTRRPAPGEEREVQSFGFPSRF